MKDLLLLVLLVLGCGQGAAPAVIVPQSPLMLEDGGIHTMASEGQTWSGSVGFWTPGSVFDGGTFQGSRPIELVVTVHNGTVYLGGPPYFCPTDQGASTIVATAISSAEASWSATPAAPHGCATGPWTGCSVGVFLFSRVTATLDEERYAQGDQLVLYGEGTVNGCGIVQPASVFFAGQRPL